MRFSTTALLGLPLLAAADAPDYQAQFQQYMGQAQGYFDKVASKIPHPNKFDPVAAAEAKAGSMQMDILGLDNWKEVLYGPVKPDATTPEDWWVLFTGGNKTCFGRCGKVEAAFNETAGAFTLTPGAPHTAMVNCDDQPVLCNAWSAPVGGLWVFEMLPEPSPINIYTKWLNFTTTTSDDLIELQKSDYKSELKLHDGMFHPFNGPLAQNKLSTPVGYIIWAFNILPSWAFMVIISMVSRSMMSNRMQNQMNDGRRPAAAGQAAAR
ncbi:hypothetical protein GGR56DRAFT_23868 [Xylariaceae sp. FL0804]|nr:hypothetical protein GGR56DRAFT_23868 [Xylariaceae sp. FL0804]